MCARDLRVRAPAGGQQETGQAACWTSGRGRCLPRGRLVGAVSGDECDDNSTDGLLLSPPSPQLNSSPSSSSPRSHVNDFGGRARPPLQREPRGLLDRCRHVDGLMLGPAAASCSRGANAVTRSALSCHSAARDRTSIARAARDCAASARSPARCPWSRRVFGKCQRSKISCRSCIPSWTTAGT